MISYRYTTEITNANLRLSRPSRRQDPYSIFLGLGFFSIENLDCEAISNLVSDKLKYESDFVALSWSVTSPEYDVCEGGDRNRSLPCFPNNFLCPIQALGMEGRSLLYPELHPTHGRSGRHRTEGGDLQKPRFI
ncbi:hypothetical protein TNCV_4113191 [Trichonephila clavipes]|nr:hypothetical protein TNCV_4113191 [Trichonephila clavipes]